MRLAGIINESVVDGEGWRTTVFFQGCLHNCKGCHNPETHDMSKGKEVSLTEVENTISANIQCNPLIEGITLSGGDPFYQADIAEELCQWFKNTYSDKSIWVYTGFTYEWLISSQSSKFQKKLLKSVDILVDGLFIESLKTLDKKFIGSSNQRIIDVKESLKHGKVIEYNMEEADVI